ncbi:hypothetical protein [Antrihabitans cavernicola]|uniref:Uncharacterized protein n=1 Tax=Antrihabitans cavernicola TaxID=2495913 RepID=A0A5A7SE01_9NOCA|nr:hypothetical protein [Spelaeibacter cavernicola]KAA0022451.1 hypothetical protein FOY51_12130 [Spelaeibacter cavernicola]
MFEQPARESISSDVFWTVQFVFDPDSLSNDFAYTIGLADRGFPELRIDATPRQDVTDAPWTLSSRDCGAQLNRFARRLVEGKLEPGRSFIEKYDHGTTTILWTPGTPTEPTEVKAYRADSSASVIPIAAELVPVEIVPLADLSEREEARWRWELGDMLTASAPNRQGLRGFRLPDIDASFSCDQSYGPLTPLVEARAYMVSQCTPEMLADVVLRSLDCERSMSTRATLGTSYSYAAAVSRTPAAWNAEALAVSLVKSIRGPQGKSSAWRAMMKMSDFGPAEDGPDIHRGLSGVLVHAVAALLVSTSVIDRLDPEMRLQAFGIWSSVVDSRSMAPDEPWWAPDHVLDIIQNEVAEIGDVRISELIEIWSYMRENEQLVTLLRGLAVTGERGSPAASELLPSSYVGVRAALDGEAEWYLTEFLCCATAFCRSAPCSQLKKSTTSAGG